MWDVLVRTPLGSLSKRKLVMSVATFLVVVLGYLFVTPTTAYAADATWEGDSISYDSKEFTGPFTAGDNDKSSLPKDTIYYANYNAASNSTTSLPNGYLIYFPKNTQTKTATQAFYSEGQFDQSTGRFSDLSPPKELSVDASTFGSAPTTQSTSCNVDGIGWIICPVSKFIAQGMDYIYGLLDGYLEVTPLTGGSNGIYQMWNIVRNIANIMFIIGFLILIYAQITGSVMSNYTLKKILPRVVVAAVLVNSSYWICAIGVDISNILGASVKELFLSMFNQLGASNSPAADIGWEKATTLVLGGGSLASVGLLSATGGGSAALAFLLIGALVPALFALFVAIIILAGRQALITVFIIISPLAFVAYLLPNTEEWFDRWRKFFMSLLIMFPAFAAVFGGSQLAGRLVIQNTSSLSVVILGLVIQVIPLFVTPLLIRLSSGLLSTIAGITNDKGKGVFDGARNWAKSNQDVQKARAMRNGLDSNRTGINRLRPTSVGSRLAYGSKHRENMTAGFNSQAEAGYYRTRRGQQAYNENKFGSDQKADAEHANEESWQRRVSGIDSSSRRTQGGRDRENSRYSDHQEMLHKSHAAETRAKIIQDSIHDEGERHVQESIANASAGSYEAQLRDRKIQSARDKGVAGLYEGKVSTLGEQAFRKEVDASEALTRVVKDTHRAKKQAEQFETIVQKAAEKSWNDRIRDDSATQELHLRAVRYEGDAKKAEQQVTKLVENINATGNAAPGLLSQSARITATQIQDTVQATSITEQAISSAKIEQQRNLANSLKTNENLRIEAAGVDSQGGVNRVMASAKKAVSDELVKATNNFQDTLDYDVASNPAVLAQNFRAATDPTEKIVYARLMARNAPGLKQLKNVLREYTAARSPEDGEVMLLKEILSGDDAFRNAGRDMEVWANNERNPQGNLYTNFEDVQDTISVINNISADRFARMNTYKQLDALYRLQENDPAALEDLITRVNASPMARNNLKGAVTRAMDGAIAGTALTDPDNYVVEDLDD